MSMDGQSSAAAMREPVYNERGVIAENYYDLQGLGVLEAARRAYPLPKASRESTLRSVFQSVEIALLNLHDLVTRAADDVAGARAAPACVKLFWMRGFHRLLNRLSMIPQQLGIGRTESANGGILRIADSPAFNNYCEALRRFDASVIGLIDSGALDAEHAVADRSLDDYEFNLLHLARVCNHESTIWERNLAEVRVPVPVASYSEFVVAEGMRDAVYDRVLSGDTYFTQFRGLHQIPETLGEEINDRCEEAIRDIRTTRLRHAVEHLDCIHVLSEGVLAAVPPMADQLATSDYHQIRENLGLTSGSHSVCLRYHMFTHLYEQLWDEYCTCVTGKTANARTDAEVEEALRALEYNCQEDTVAWTMHLLGNCCLKLRAFISAWRDEHLHMPRNNLGGESTKSLTGSPDAVKAVMHMRDGAIAKDPMAPLARARGLASELPRAGSQKLTSYLDSAGSLDRRLLAVTGQITQRRFSDVQERLGFFANRCPFVPPPRRKA